MVIYIPKVYYCKKKSRARTHIRPRIYAHISEARRWAPKQQDAL